MCVDSAGKFKARRGCLSSEKRPTDRGKSWRLVVMEKPMGTVEMIAGNAMNVLECTEPAAKSQSPCV